VIALIVHLTENTMTDISLTPQQTDAMNRIRGFLKTPGAGVFILRGYAGTGKTTLLQTLGLWLKENEKDFVMLAPTGRAATVLRAKTGLDAKTIHSELYVFNKIDGEPDADLTDPEADQFGQMRLMFSARASDPDEEKIYIVDEASMISDEPGDEMSYAHFGSGHLLSDLLYAAGTNKIIFSGDPAQLPPIGSSDSPALSATFMSRQGRSVTSFDLTDILRQKSDNEILKLATRVRALTSLDNYPKWLKLPARETGQVSLMSYESMKDAYFRHVATHGYADSIAVCHSNLNCADINRSLRQQLYGKDHAPLQVGDLLMVTQNNHLVPLSNGDFVEVRHVGEKQYHEGLAFISIRVKAQLSGLEHECLLCEELLYNGHANLMPHQQRMIMIEFSRRMRRRKVKPGSDAYMTALRTDPYLNSLRANFGYAVTCNKSQGGEWTHVFFFIHKGMYVMPRPSLARWWYTGITRAKEKLYLSSDWWIG
jgi:ATP-dependent exoDNAse (exonuclease V) alpha subunit